MSRQESVSQKDETLDDTGIRQTRQYTKEFQSQNQLQNQNQFQSQNQLQDQNQSQEYNRSLVSQELNQDARNEGQKSSQGSRSKFRIVLIEILFSRSL